MWNTHLSDKDKCELELPEDGTDDVNLEGVFPGTDSSGNNDPARKTKRFQSRVY